VRFPGGNAGTPGRRDAGTPGRRDAGTPGRRDANRQAINARQRLRDQVRRAG
jgi:hypothetical protein